MITVGRSKWRRRSKMTVLLLILKPMTYESNVCTYRVYGNIVHQIFLVRKEVGSMTSQVLGPTSLSVFALFKIG